MPGRLARTVLRGDRRSNAAVLPDNRLVLRWRLSGVKPCAGHATVSVEAPDYRDALTYGPEERRRREDLMSLVLMANWTVPGITAAPAASCMRRRR
jgi:hypothetical protein